ncbi:KAP family P-loop domain protein [anaerobic digester metagenome]
MNNLRLLTDQALGEGNDLENDGLDFSTYASVLANAALETPGPFTIGIFGEWGTGKTSLMRMIMNNLNTKNDNYNQVTVWFNAWRYENEEHPIIPLIIIIIKELEKNIKNNSKFENYILNLITSLQTIANGLSIKSTLKIPFLGELEAIYCHKDKIEREKELTSDSLQDQCVYFQLFETLSTIKFDDDFKIIVFIDDLDRCFPNQAIKLLESIKLVLSQSGFIFFLGVAKNIIEGYLEHRNITEFGIEKHHGQLYLDKIIQLPFHIPSHRVRMDKFSENILNRIDHTLKNEIKEILPIVHPTLGNNPRTIVRFINNLLIDNAIYTELFSENSEPQIFINYFAVNRCFQLRWSNIFTKLAPNDKWCEGVQKYLHSGEESPELASNSQYLNIAKFIFEDDELKLLLSSKSGTYWLINHEKRHASIEFLEIFRKEERIIENLIKNDILITCDKSDIGIANKFGNYLFEKNNLNRVMVYDVSFGKYKLGVFIIGRGFLHNLQNRQLLEKAFQKENSIYHYLYFILDEVPKDQIPKGLLQRGTYIDLNKVEDPKYMDQLFHNWSNIL